MTAVVLGQLVGSLLLAAPPVYAQSVVSTFTPDVSGAVAPTAPLAPGAETVMCSGKAKVATTPATAANVVVSIDVTGLECVGATTGARYVNTGYANLTRSLVASEVIETTFAVYRDVPGGVHRSRTALLTLNLTYDTTTGALTSAAGRIGNLP